MKKFYVLGVATIFLLGVNGCAPSAQIRRDERIKTTKRIGKDLAKIIQKHDCEAICIALKAYIKSQIEGAIK